MKNVLKWLNYQSDNVVPFTTYVGLIVSIGVLNKQESSLVSFDHSAAQNERSTALITCYYGLSYF